MLQANFPCNVFVLVLWYQFIIYNSVLFTIQGNNTKQRAQYKGVCECMCAYGHMQSSSCPAIDGHKWLSEQALSAGSKGGCDNNNGGTGAPAAGMRGWAWPNDGPLWPGLRVCPLSPIFWLVN